MQLDRYMRYRELYQEQNVELKKLQNELNNRKNTAVENAPAQTAVTSAAPASAPAVEATGEFDEYVVKSGDSLSKIARQAYGSAAKRYLDAIRNANDLKNDNIRLNQKLKLPKLK